MASNQLRVNCTCNYYSCWGNFLIQSREFSFLDVATKLGHCIVDDFAALGR